MMTSPNNHIKKRLIIGPSLIRDGFSSLLLSLGYFLLACHNSGKQMIANLSADDLSYIILVDVVGQETAALETTAWLREHCKRTQTLAGLE